MKLLLDENLPHDVRHFLPNHDTVTVAYLGWQGVENGELLKRAAQAGFDALLTKDTGMAFQQNVADLPVAVVIIRAPSNALEDLRPVLPMVLKALSALKPRSLVRVG